MPFLQNCRGVSKLYPAPSPRVINDWTPQPYLFILLTVKKNGPDFRVFSHPSTDDEERDIALQKKIRSLQWITEQHLEAEIDLQKEQVQRLVEEAQDGRQFFHFAFFRIFSIHARKEIHYHAHFKLFLKV